MNVTSMSTSKNWCFTLNNYTDDTESLMEVSHEEIAYIIFSKEVGASGTPHLQGYLELNKRMSIIGIKRLFEVSTLHLEPRRGTQQNAIDYCLKDGGYFYERGTKAKGAGRPANDSKEKVKNGILQHKELIKKSLVEFADHPDCSYSMLKHARDYVAITESPRDRKKPLELLWFWGKTGSGKTRKAFDMAEKRGLTPFVKGGDYKWFDGYQGHKFVIFDDFRDEQCPFGWLLRLTDRYQVTVEVKCSTRQWKPETIIITSPMSPEMMYKKNQNYASEDKIEQLLRRITRIEEIVNYEPEELEPTVPAEQDPQTPQGGQTVIRMFNSRDLITPPRFRYPIDVNSPLPPLPRPIPLLGDYLHLGRVPSPTQDWKNPLDSE